MNVVVHVHAWVDCVRRGMCCPFPFASVLSWLPTSTQSFGSRQSQQTHRTAQLTPSVTPDDKVSMTREGLRWPSYSVVPVALACMTFQLVLKCELWEGMIRRLGEECFVSNTRS